MDDRLLSGAADFAVATTVSEWVSLSRSARMSSVLLPEPVLSVAVVVAVSSGVEVGESAS
ncbi:hypothetical protein IU501_21820 [Nocardia otitidiscaviarum]|uniref:hypothetical protein n=1 Tax=Nocardia otitidiscaviarum TaxID=1823 RepID=UPI0005B9714F|nr:hypothetical protein [Nocardia otitidiscaviarum]MBF6135630.1 hypothetical protein [Nocardia otitidiscaviarum]MBF6487448.1 hypothetical protein [Nocardia otitidiscaviarum]